VLKRFLHGFSDDGVHSIPREKFSPRCRIGSPGFGLTSKRPGWYDPGMRGKHICTLIACLCLASAAITAQAAQKQRAFTPENSGFNIMPIAPADDNGAALDPTVLPNNPGNAAAVPEPATWGMLILGSGLLAGVRRFRRKHL
jgi:hypothetical protein